MTGIDVHKPNRPATAEMGGLAVLVGLAVGSAVFLLASPPEDGAGLAFVAGLSAIGFTGVVGIVDDLFDVRQRYKPFMIVVASLPLVYFLLDRGSVFIPLMGSVDVGLIFPLVAVPLAVTTTANFSNMFAGFNGLEGGVAVISLAALSFLTMVAGDPTLSALAAIIAAAYLGFLFLNWYPAKIFPGDTGTLMAGAAVAVIGILGRLEFVVIILSIPAAMDFTLKAARSRPFSGRKEHGDASVGPDGVLHPAPYPALAHAFMMVSPTKERGLVVALLAMQALFAVVAIAVALDFL